MEKNTDKKSARELWEELLEKIKKISSAKIIALGYLAVIFTGTLLLKLPIASREKPLGWLDTLFTAVSASCVTGLAAADTYTQWSLFGQIVIICLIQIGGLGFMTVISLAGLITGRRIGLKERSVLQDSVNNMQVGGIVKLMRRVAAGTFIIEGIGAALLAVRLIPKMGVLTGIGNSLFLSISAFCNGGFDLNGKYGQYCSLVPFADDVLVNVVICMLILTGSIGFTVWEDFLKHKFRFSAYKLHSKIALTVTVLLTVIGMVLFLLFEQDYTFKGMPFWEQLTAAFFSSVTPRTAGFNTVDTAALSPASKALTVLYMFIGGSPGSTAGGIKTVTLAVLILTAMASMRGNDDVNVFGRRLEADAARRAVTVVTVNLALAVTAILGISAAQPEFALPDVVIETFSAVNTVGMTTGITRELLPFSKLLLIMLMYSGRVGSVSFALIFTGKRRFTGVQNPEEPISIG
ncbi:MAG: Trk family potassium uptake protein [Oscillospiraceae bacterium]|nr:Trk family potassium uptake protein [Oscillospiraceae bacterium]